MYGRRLHKTEIPVGDGRSCGHRDCRESLPQNRGGGGIDPLDWCKME